MFRLRKLFQLQRAASRDKCYRPQLEGLERRDIPSLAVLPRTLSDVVPVSGASFTDPAALLVRTDRIRLGSQDYIAPYALLDARQGRIRIGSQSNVQDNVFVVPGSGGIRIGDRAILAHGATAVGNSTIGRAGGKPCFVGFNAIVSDAIVEPDAMVGILAKVSDGVTIHSGLKVLPGKWVQTQDEADDPDLGKVAPVTAGDRKFMRDVIHVNVAFAEGYTKLQEDEGRASVLGISKNPSTEFNPNSVSPTLAGIPTTNPRSRDRIIGNVTMADSLAKLAKVLGVKDSIRADEGFPFVIGAISRWNDRVTVHALEHTNIRIGSGSQFGFHSVIHGGKDDGNSPKERTTIGKNVIVGDLGVVFRSTIGDGCVIGNGALVESSQLAPGTIVKNGSIIVKNEFLGTVEWW